MFSFFLELPDERDQRQFSPQKATMLSYSAVGTLNGKMSSD